jgi:HK97 gp10 family phage protein
LIGVAIRKAAFDLEARAKMRTPVDTGALRNSIYTRIGGGHDGWSSASGSAENAAGRRKSRLLRFARTDDKATRSAARKTARQEGSAYFALKHIIPAEPDPGPLAAVVAVCVNYAAFVEFGTARHAPHPFFGPAVEETRAEFFAAIEQAMRIGENE